MHLMWQRHLGVEQVVVGMWNLALGKSWHPRVQPDHPAGVARCESFSSKTLSSTKASKLVVLVAGHV